MKNLQFQAKTAVFAAVVKSPTPGGLLLLKAISTMDYSPDQPRDEHGRWTNGGSNGKMGKTKYAPSPRRNYGGINLEPEEYVRMTGILNTRYPGLQAGEIRTIYGDKYVYKVEADGYGGFITKKKRKLKPR